MGRGLREAGRNVYCLVPRFSLGKKGAQILIHFIFISVSVVYIRKIRVMVIKSRKRFEEGHEEVQEENTEGKAKILEMPKKE